MKKTLQALVLILLVSLFAFSCAGAPKPQDTDDEYVASSQSQGSVLTEPDQSSLDEPESVVSPSRTDEAEPDYLLPEPELVSLDPELDEIAEEQITANDTQPVLPDTIEPAVVPADSSPETLPESSASTTQPAPVPPPAAAPVPAPVTPPVQTAPALVAPPPAVPVPAPVTPPAISPAPVPAPEDLEKVPEIWTDEERISEPPPPVVPKTLIPSRTVTVPRDGILEVWYPGTGWVYLGDASGQIGVSYETRKIENRDTLFSFRARRVGNYILEFSRYDVLTDDFIQDALSVTVTEPVPGKRTTVRAPDFVLGGVPPVGSTADDVQKGSSILGDEPVLSSPSALSGTAPVAEKEQTAEELLAIAQGKLASGDAPGALEALDMFFEKAVKQLDEGWFLRGQTFEANSPARNIRKALEAYETVVSAYPESARWKAADERVRYIRQFYFKVR